MSIAAVLVADDDLKGRVKVVEEPHDTFHGVLEFILRDCSRFWITLGQPANG